MKTNRLLLTGLMIALVLLSGCITVNTRVELHRDKSIDMRIGAESETEMLLSTMKKSIGSELANGTAKLEERNNSFYYRWSSVRMPVVDTPNGSDTPETLPNFNMSHEYSFPASYRYRIELESEGMDTGTSNSSGMMGGLDNSIGFNYYIKPFGEVVDTNGIETDNGYVKLDATKNRTYFIEFKDNVWNMWFSGEACQERWECTEWSDCSEGYRKRTCTAEKKCENYLYRPSEKKSCGTETETSAESNPLLSSESSDTETNSFFKKQLEKEVTHLEIDSSSIYPENWDADADEDGFKFQIKPKASDDTVVPLNGSLEVKLFSLRCNESSEYSYSCSNYKREKEVYNKEFEIGAKDFETSDFSETVEASEELKVNWDDVESYNSSAPDHGEMFATLTTSEEKKVSANIEAESYSVFPTDIPLRSSE